MHTIHFSHENIPINNVTIGNLRNGTGDVVKYKKQTHDFFCTLYEVLAHREVVTRRAFRTHVGIL